MAASKIDRLIETWDPVLQKAFIESFNNVKNLSQINQIVKALENGDVTAAMKAVNLDTANFRPFDKAIAAAFEAGGNSTAGGFPPLGEPGKLRVYFQFNIRNTPAEQWLMNYSSSLVSDITTDQRNMIHEAMTRGLAAGDNPRTIALDLVGKVGPKGQRTGGLIGLTQSQSRWVDNYASKLASSTPTDALTSGLRDKRFDKAVLQAEEDGIPLSDDLQEKMVASYSNRALRYRAEAIARSEATTALHESQQQAIEQAVVSEAISRDQVKFIWRTARDKRVRDSHAAMEGEEVAMGDFFITGNGNSLEYPGDPNGPPSETINCRCWREPSIDFYSSLV